MGLDMYLYRVPVSVRGEEEVSAHVEKCYEESFNARTESNPWPSPEVKVAYWRKANAIHRWFVDNVQNGEDECSYDNEVSLSKMEELLETAKRVKETKGTNELAPVGGFFFGSTKVDEFYWEDIDQTIDQLERVIADTDFNEQRIVYHSSW